VPGADCDELTRAFKNHYTYTDFVGITFLLMPMFLGMFWGAPLVARELEAGTHRLAWTQSVTRRRWILTKLAIIGGSTAAFAGLFTLGFWWWSHAQVLTGWNSFEVGLFDLLGIVPIAYALFAVAVGVALGTLIRKTLPAVFTTLGIFVAVRIVFMAYIRRHYLPAKSISAPLGADLPQLASGAWRLSEHIVDTAGRIVSTSSGVVVNGVDVRYLAAHCPGISTKIGDLASKDAMVQCFSKLGLRTVVTYHPANQFWTFQAIEAGVFLLMTGLLVALVLRRIQRLS
jgi:ABC-type transport system involved in multi-copper enzyme maturation permease subunit